MPRWLTDPLVVFLAGGLLIFWVAGFTNPAKREVIEVTTTDLDRIRDQWQAQMGREPGAEELNGLVEQFVHEEIYYREALKSGLDDNDTIIRRRLVQKLTFLTEDLATGAPPTVAELEDWFADNAERYRKPERFTFSHRYFSHDRRDDAHGDALVALSDPTNEGDPFMLQRDYAQRSEREIGNLLGNEFATALAALAPGSNWQGPLPSAYGFHLVVLRERLPSELPGFAQVRERVAADYQAERRAQANDAYFEAVRSRYDVRLPEAG
jgi:hypothetical protein